jgi:hypothetical protein
MTIQWFDTLLDYNFSVVHCSGSKLVLPDHLSRLFSPAEPARDNKLVGGNNASHSGTVNLSNANTSKLVIHLQLILLIKLINLTNHFMLQSQQ